MEQEAKVNKIRAMTEPSVGKVTDWETFKKSWKSSTFISKFIDMDSNQIEEQFRFQFNNLINDKSKLCYLFKDTLKANEIQIVKKVLKEFKYKLASEYESMYYGNKKQLLVYKCTVPSLSQYLLTYRLPDSYKKPFNDLTTSARQMIKMQQQKNMLISSRTSKDSQEFQKLLENIRIFQESQLQPKSKTYLTLVEKLIEDFQRQSTKQQIPFMGVCSIVEQFLKGIVKKHGLYLSYRFLNISEYDENKDIIVSKQTRSEYQEREFEDEFDDAEDIEQVQKGDSDNTEKENPKRISTVENKCPKDIESVEITGFTEDGPQCEITLLPFGKNNETKYLEIGILYPKNIQQKYVEQINYQQNDIAFSGKKIIVTLPLVAQGYCSYSIIAKNDVGSSKVAIVEVCNRVTSTKEKKIDKSNYDLFILGYNETGIILNSQKGIFETEFLADTYQNWVPSPIKGQDFSVSTSLVACNHLGDVAGWGKMYVYDGGQGLAQSKNALKDDEEGQDDNQFAFFKQDTFTLEKPSILLSDVFIRKVSCGQCYCLMADSHGNAWSFGLNNYGQLGQQEEGNQKDRTEPAMINRFKQEQVFIIDVIASTCGSSFAIDSENSGYRWGFNQIQMSNKAVKDFDNNVINYHYSEILFSQPVPLKISNNQIPEKISSFHPGYSFTLALTTQNNLYGWGDTKYLLPYQFPFLQKDNIQNICNPIKIDKNIQQVSVGGFTTIIQRRDQNDRGLYGWGNLDHWNNYRKERDPNVKYLLSKYEQKPIRLQESFDGQFICGEQMTVLQRSEEQEEIEVIGSQKIFKKKKYKLPCKTSNIKIGKGVIVVMPERQ